jgi:hypothetical protein
MPRRQRCPVRDVAQIKDLTAVRGEAAAVGGEAAVVGEEGTAGAMQGPGRLTQSVYVAGPADRAGTRSIAQYFVQDQSLPEPPAASAKVS